MSNASKMLTFSVVLLASVFIADFAQAQRRADRTPLNPPTPTPVQPAPDIRQPATPAPSPPQKVDERSTSGRMEGHLEASSGRILHGSQLTNLRVWNAENQRLATVKDFVIYSVEGQCPTIYFALVPEISGMNEEYVIVPYDALILRYDDRVRTPYFFLDIGINQFREAPHFAINRWKSFDDRQLLTSTQQFYRRVERTAAKPRTEMRDNKNLPNEPAERKTPPAVEDPNKQRDSDKKDNTGGVLPNKEEQGGKEDNVKEPEKQLDKSDTNQSMKRDTEKSPENTPKPPESKSDNSSRSSEKGDGASNRGSQTR